MKNSLQYLMFSILVLVLGAAAEELLPKFFGVGFPILLAATHFVGSRRTTTAAVLFALTAGGMTDALSSLPTMTSAGFFLVIALLLQYAPYPRLAMLASYPLYQVWLAIWIPGIGGGIYARILVSLLLGGLTVLLTGLILSWCEERMAIDEVG